MNRYTLHEQSSLQSGKYHILQVLGQGGFGITYLAEQSMLKMRVAIKEFFIRDLCARDDSSTVYTVTQSDMVGRYRQKFIKEAQMIAHLKHPGIVNVSDIFEENGTVYYVMEYIEGESLAEKVKRNGPLSEQTALRYIFKVAEALDYLHNSRVNHLDIKPANIMVRDANDDPVIIDFGVSKQYDEQKDQTTTTPPGVSTGYSPLEQYMSGGVSTFSPQADIYALGATLYKLLTGNTPPNASDILSKGLPHLPTSISADIRKAIEKAMQPRSLDRPQSISEFLGMIEQEQQNEPTIEEDEPTIIIDSSDYDEEMIYDSNRIDGIEKGENIKQFEVGVMEWIMSTFNIVLFVLTIVVAIVVHNFLPLGVFLVMFIISIIIIFFYEKGSMRETKHNSAFIINAFHRKEKYSNVDIIDNLIANMVYIDGGTFTMGATIEQESDSWSDEKPTHQVTLSSFSIGRYEVTQEEWQVVMGFNPSQFKGEKRPVEQVSWNDCQEFISRLNAMTGKHFRLPTEAEWEFAARGGNISHGKKYAGGNNLKDVAWYDRNSGNQTHPVGQKQPNELGLYDMSGNVWEWCNDLYGNYSSSSQNNPKGPSSGDHHVRRGGGWNNVARNCRVSRRYLSKPSGVRNNRGFRLAL